MKTYHVFIETSKDAISEGGPLAHVPELPGCTARAKTVDAVKQAIRQTVHDYTAFLRAEGERDLPEEFDLKFEETQSLTLAPDYAPMTAEEIERAKRWLDASRHALLAELADLPDDAWDWKPGVDDWPLHAIADHIGESELWYTDKLMEPDRAPLDRLDVTRRISLDRLDALAPQDVGHVTIFEGEDWTLRKILRRMLEHQQEHLVQVRDLVARYNKDRLPQMNPVDTVDTSLHDALGKPPEAQDSA
jgi:predicted RNase H-like HicB family nuclease